MAPAPLPDQRLGAERFPCLVLTIFTASACGGTISDSTEGTSTSGERLCEARLGLSGAFTQEAPQPSDVFGCWPVGAWSFSAVLEENACPSEPTLEAQYVFRVVRDEDSNETYTYVNNPAYERVHMKVTSGGSGLCAGSFQIFSLDGKQVLNLKPALNADNTIDGFAEYYLYESDQWESGD